MVVVTLVEFLPCKVAVDDDMILDIMLLLVSGPSELSLALIVNGEFILDEEASFPLPSVDRRVEIILKSGLCGLPSSSGRVVVGTVGGLNAPFRSCNPRKSSSYRSCALYSKYGKGT
jgi:hypothetical protein